MILLVEFVCGTPPSSSCLKVIAYRILVSALGLIGLGTKGLGPGLDNKSCTQLKVI